MFLSDATTSFTEPDPSERLSRQGDSDSPRGLTGGEPDAGEIEIGGGSSFGGGREATRLNHISGELWRHRSSRERRLGRLFPLSSDWWLPMVKRLFIFFKLGCRSRSADLDPGHYANVLASEKLHADDSLQNRRTDLFFEQHRRRRLGRTAEPIPPKFFNSFEFISSMSSGFDLSSLFESKRKVQSIFTSRWSATKVMEKIERLRRK